MLATLAHTDTARAVARDTGWDIDGWARDHEWSAVGVGPVGRSRDSEALEASNFRTARAILDDAGARYAIAHFGHWAVGWIDELTYDAGDPATVAAVDAIRARLDNYPVLDDDDYYQQEWLDNHPDGARVGRYCYADRAAECHYTDGLGRIVQGRDDRGRFVGTRC